MTYNLILSLILFFLYCQSSKYFLSRLVVLMGLSIIFFPYLYGPQFSTSNLVAMSSASSRSIFFFICCFFVPTRESLFKLFAHTAVLNSIFIVVNPGHYGLGLASTFDTTLIAIMYPVVVMHSLSIKRVWLRWTYLLTPVASILYIGGSVGVGGLCLCLSILLVRGRKYLYLILIPGLLFLFAMLTDKHLFNDSLRFVCWRWSMDYWRELPLFNHLFGTGLGTFQILGPMIQIITKNMAGNWYVEMHNDWLQCLFELGVVGLTTALVTFFYLTWKVRSNRFLLSSVLTYGACAIFYYPTRNIVTAAYGVFILKLCLDYVD